MSHDGWNRVSSQNPCPICGKSDNCTVSEDGGVVWCGRIEDGSVRQNAGGQFLHFQNDQSAAIRPMERSSYSGRSNVARRTDLPMISRHWFEANYSVPKREELASILGVSVASLFALHVGWNGNVWTWPERDGAGNIIGVTQRYPDGSKRQLPGGQRGLIYSEQWSGDSGPLFLTEGGSDTAAALTIGVNAVGRPSNTGGIQHLIQLLRGFPSDRDLIVLAENDRKLADKLPISIRSVHRDDCDGCSQCWPGKWGAIRTAGQLKNELCRKVGWCFPELGSKDVREWLRKSRNGL